MNLRTAFQTNFFDSFPNAVYICDQDGQITYFNQRAVELWGRTPALNDSQELFSGSYKIYNLEGQAMARQMLPITQTLRQGEIIKNLKVILEQPNGKKIVAQASISPIRDEQGQIVGAINIFQDVTEQHNLENKLHSTNKELKWSTEELEQMAYCASHDLREPLRVASTYIQLLSKKYNSILDQEAKGYITTAVQSCERARQLINDLLTYNRVRGKYSSFQTFNLKEALDHSLLSLKVAIEEAGAVITSEDLPFIFGDESKISLVFQNLLGNAIKFCKKAPQIHIFVKKNSNNVTIGIQDNGIGMDSEYKEKIFEIFQRLHSSSQYPGSGIG